ncbi:hypothetical protein BDN72DRAFT_767578 [Pluteus cervinus]|uniref:Uncharacterized protein n=1 Tax=Pluteus cervinus TaxID=181527 RepID=A0ACD3AWZ9_9AGAR|nr:hypothetical protein BDN72DRAFT_767578 [Pluteus cervinus]
MRFTPLLATTFLTVSSVSANFNIASLNINTLVGNDLGPDNKYGAPIAPWLPNHKPGWYIGHSPTHYPELPCLRGFICRVLAFFPFHLQCPTPLPPPPPPPTPPPSDGYHQTFSNLTGATQAADYLTFGLVDTVADCKAMCNGVTGCDFVNTYHDVNGKGGSTQLTCSLFSQCHDASDADNVGGQTQADGTVDFITNSDGFCKDS